MGAAFLFSEINNSSHLGGSVSASTVEQAKTERKISKEIATATHENPRGIVIRRSFCRD